METLDCIFVLMLLRGLAYLQEQGNWLADLWIVWSSAVHIWFFVDHNEKLFDFPAAVH